MTNNNTESRFNQTNVNKKVKPHVTISIEDWDWIDTQQGFVRTLWKESWKADPFGNRWVKIDTSLSKNRFLSARLILAEAGLFEFKYEEILIDKHKQKVWYVKNKHGAKCLTYWGDQSGLELNPNGLELNPNGLELNPNGLELNPNGLRLSGATHTQQEFENLSGSYSVSSQESSQEEIQEYKPIDPKKEKDQITYIPSARVSACVVEEENKLMGEEATLDATPPNDQGEEWRDIKIHLEDKSYVMRCLISEYQEIETFREFLSNVQDDLLKTKREREFKRSFLMAYKHRVIRELVRVKA